MWPPPTSDDVICNYSFLEHSQTESHHHHHHNSNQHTEVHTHSHNQSQNQNENHPQNHHHHQHDHYHHNHYPQTSTNNFECYQTLSCPSNLPVETSFFNSPQQYHDLNSPHELWCPPDKDCSHDRCVQHWKDVPVTGNSPNNYWCPPEKDCAHQKCADHWKEVPPTNYWCAPEKDCSHQRCVEHWKHIPNMENIKNSSPLQQQHLSMNNSPQDYWCAPEKDCAHQRCADHWKETSPSNYWCAPEKDCSHQRCVEHWKHVPDMGSTTNDSPLQHSMNNSPQDFWCPPEEECRHKRCAEHWKNIPHEQSKIFHEITKECEHLLKKDDCEKCNIRTENGDEEVIKMDDLVEIVRAAAEDINKKEANKEEIKLLSRKRQQNKVAAARYRDKQKSKWQELINEKNFEEARNKKLKKEVEKLEKETSELKTLFLTKLAD